MEFYHTWGSPKRYKDKILRFVVFSSTTQDVDCGLWSNVVHTKKKKQFNFAFDNCDIVYDIFR